MMALVIGLLFQVMVIVSFAGWAMWRIERPEPLPGDRVVIPIVMFTFWMIGAANEIVGNDEPAIALGWINARLYDIWMDQS